MTWSVLEWSESEWGAGLPALMIDRILQFTRGPVFRTYVSTLATRTETIIAVAELITFAFNLNTAVGVHLDRIGGIIQSERPTGMGDEPYRILLQIQVQIILSSQGSTANLLEIVRLYTGTPAPEYAEGYESAWVGIGANYSDDPATLLELLRKAKAGGVALSLLLSDDDILLADYEPDPIAGAGIADYEPDPIIGAGTTVYEIEI